MKNKQFKYLVIDTSIARSCGKENSIHLTSKHCRDFLQTVLNLGHCMVMTDELKEEWNKHQSSFAKKWRATMIAKRQYKMFKDVTRYELRRQIEILSDTYQKREAIWKDICLIEASLITDKIIISLDEKMRKYLAEISDDIFEIKLILWTNPDKNDDDSIQWLENGALMESTRLLGYKAND